MKLQVQLLIASILTIGLAACCSEEGKRRAGAVDPTATPAPTTPAAKPSATAAGGKGIALQVAQTPGFALSATVEKAGCENGLGRAAVVKVQWKAEKEGISSVRILAAREGEQSKIWHEGGAAGAETTGPWIEGGSRLEVVNAATQEALGTITAEAAACAQ